MLFCEVEGSLFDLSGETGKARQLLQSSNSQGLTPNTCGPDSIIGDCVEVPALNVVCRAFEGWASASNQKIPITGFEAGWAASIGPVHHLTPLLWWTIQQHVHDWHLAPRAALCWMGLPFKGIIWTQKRIENKSVDFLMVKQCLLTLVLSMRTN